MKHNSFIRFYLLFFVVACLFIYGFTQLYKRFVAPPLYHIVNVEDVFSALQENELPEFKILPKSALQLGEDALTQLQNQEIVAFEIGDKSFYIKALNDDQYVKWGPVHAESWSDSNDSIVVLLFYSALALIFLMMFRPLFRDVAHLQSCAIKFGKKPDSQPLTISPRSSVFPLAQALYNMSHQLLEQIQIHKDLSKIIAHEVRTPLSRMKFVLQKVAKDLPEKEMVRLKTDIKELETLAHEYLEFGRSQATDEDYLSTIDLNEFLQLLIEKYCNTSPAVKFIQTQPNIVFMGNWYQLELAITNLINNAVRYAETQIQVSAQLTDDRIEFSVEDDGPGFTNTQKQNASGEQHQGFGLGLYLVKQIAARHKGEFSIGESVFGGAKMSLSFKSE